MIFPQINNVWRQLNIGDRFGDLVASFNLNFSDEQGKLKVAPRLVLNTASTDDADLGVPFAIVFNTSLGQWHVGAGAVMFVGGDLPNESFTQDTASTPPSMTTTTRPDLATFVMANGDTHTYAMSAELSKLNITGTAWSTITSLGGSTNGAPLIPFSGRLYYRIGTDQMGSINQSDTPVAPTNTYALDLNDAAQHISCGRASSSFIYLGTRANPGQKALVHEWNGSSTAVSRSFIIDAEAVEAMAIIDNTPIILDSNGVLRMLNGSAFVEIARFPFRKGKAIRPITTGGHTTWLCHYNGMIADKDRILMVVNTTYADGTTDEFIPSGLWEWNAKNGLFHVGSFGLSKSGDSITDYGAQKLSAIGAISNAKVNDTSSNGTVLAACTFFTTATVTKIGIFYDDANDTLQKAGTFITPKIFSSNIQDTWQAMFVRFRKFLNSTDKIVVKYRTEEGTFTEATITYTSTTTLTVPTASFTTAPAVGDEIEIIQGVGAGRTAHITVITTSAPNYVITVDETITGATTQTAKARFQTWKKIGTYNAQADEWWKFPLTGASVWVQFKVWILWTGRNEIHDLIISNKGSQLIQ